MPFRGILIRDLMKVDSFLSEISTLHIASSGTKIALTRNQYTAPNLLSFYDKAIQLFKKDATICYFKYSNYGTVNEYCEWCIRLDMGFAYVEQTNCGWNYFATGTHNEENIATFKELIAIVRKERIKTNITTRIIDILSEHQSGLHSMEIKTLLGNSLAQVEKVINNNPKFYVDDDKYYLLKVAKSTQLELI